MSDRVLAVDLGLRSGLACFDADGRLLWYRSTNFGSRARLKRGVVSVLDEAFPGGAPGGHLVMEGGGDLAPPWIREAERRGIRVTQIHAHTWRQDILLDRDQRHGRQAKLTADTVARDFIEQSGAKRPTSLRHDAAEAILIGLWAIRARKGH